MERIRSHISQVSFNSPSGAVVIISDELSDTRRGVPGDRESDSEVSGKTDDGVAGLSTDGL
jgi:hypothetical protein